MFYYDRKINLLRKQKKKDIIMQRIYKMHTRSYNSKIHY